MDEEKRSIKQKLSTIVVKGGSTIKKEVLNPVCKGVQNLYERIVRYRYNHGWTSVTRKGLYCDDVIATILEKENPITSEPRYWVKVRVNTVERVYENPYLWKYPVGERVLLTVFIKSRDTLDYVPTNPSSSLRYKQVIYSVPLEHRMAGIMKL